VYGQVPQTATWRLTRGPDTRFLKVTIEGWTRASQRERARLGWAGDRLPVPAVLDGGSDDGVEWLLITGLPGLDATAHRLRHDPATLVPILARGLRAFHEVRVEGCPFDFRLDAALDLIGMRLEGDLVVPETDFHDEHRHFTPQRALDHLRSRRPGGEDVVFCHGDYCLPNVLIDDEGGITGYVDLGESGLADRWWDLAVATWSVTWNLGPGWEQLFLDEYGIELDPERSAYYRLMYDMAT
jgi:kanamycin kinase